MPPLCHDATVRTSGFGNEHAERGARRRHILWLAVGYPIRLWNAEFGFDSGRPVARGRWKPVLQASGARVAEAPTPAYWTNGAEPIRYGAPAPRASEAKTVEGGIRLWSMIDHISLNVSDAKASRAFYESALAPLGYRVLMEFEGMYGLGAQTGPDLWLVPAESPTPVHLALTAESTQQVDDFHRAALAAGGADNGAPGERPHYHPGYYGAFVLDPDGHNLEAVFHGTGE